MVNQTPECLCQQPIGFALYLLLVRLYRVSSRGIPPSLHPLRCTTYQTRSAVVLSPQKQLLAWLTNANTSQFHHRGSYQALKSRNATSLYFRNSEMCCYANNYETFSFSFCKQRNCTAKHRTKAYSKPYKSSWKI